LASQSDQPHLASEKANLKSRIAWRASWLVYWRIIFLSSSQNLTWWVIWPVFWRYSILLYYYCCYCYYYYMHHQFISKFHAGSIFVFIFLLHLPKGHRESKASVVKVLYMTWHLSDMVAAHCTTSFAAWQYPCIGHRTGGSHTAFPDHCVPSVQFMVSAKGPKLKVQKKNIFAFLNHRKKASFSPLEYKTRHSVTLTVCWELISKHFL
jgi:hypothetical protein